MEGRALETAVWLSHNNDVNTSAEGGLDKNDAISSEGRREAERRH